MQNIELKQFDVAVYYSGKSSEGDEVHRAETDPPGTSTTAEEAGADGPNTECDQLLGDSGARQNSMGIWVIEAPSEPTVEVRHISDGIRQTAFIASAISEIAHNSGEFLSHLESIHRDPTLTFIGLLTLKS
ncbi:unnamed protein product [Adineta steineri]|uniref:Uncharacterized protein n=1 Tax=Adineta steineri TaxID=433720 RepID=A0A819I1F7_9BILA|nr:unnamed protein product [Adineta steineri]CAF3904988.1 unnamed protein product [Adineta steineri]